MTRPTSRLALVTAALRDAERPDNTRPLVFRDPKESRRLARPF